jgi:4,5-dihydroxyphthalate decarboxylase
MADPKLVLAFREPDIDTQRPFVDGQVKVEGFELETRKFTGPESCDAWDASFGGLMQVAGRGEFPYVSIPAFPNRKFRHQYCYVNVASGIDAPRDLEGKRVYVSSTAGIWARGALLNYYEVDFTKIHWVMASGGEGGGAKSWGPGIDVEPLPRGANVDAMLLSGELDCVIEPNVLPSISKRDPRVRRLFPDFKSEEQKYFRETGIFPISHMVSLNKAFVEKHPNAPIALLNAYRQARDIALDSVGGPDGPLYVTLSWAVAAQNEQREVMGERYYAYNVVDNTRPLEAMMQFCHQFGITPTRLDYRQFLHEEAAAYPGW